MNRGYVVIKDFMSEAAMLLVKAEFDEQYKTLSQGAGYLPGKGHGTKPSWSAVGFSNPVLLSETNYYVLRRLFELPSSYEEAWLVNYREYRGETEAVPPHHDGLYYGLQDVDGYGTFIEGILSPFTMILTLSNENVGSGTYLLSKQGFEIDIQAGAGDLLIFDNINYRHGVRALPLPRSMIAARAVSGKGIWLGQAGVPVRKIDEAKECGELLDNINRERIRERIKK